VSALARACHPLPTVAVTACAVALAVAAGNAVSTCVLLAAAAFAGQLTVGWSNDRLDWRADRQVGRTEKPIAAGEISPRAVEIAILVAAVACIGLSLALGWRAGATHLAAVACAWAYNLWLKGTWLSWLPYALAFAAVPTVATLALPSHPAPPVWAVAVGALIGIAANLTNALPDLDRDQATGFRGLPSRLGAHVSVILALVLVVAMSAIVAFGPPGPPTAVGWTGLALTVAAVAATAPALMRRAPTRVPFYALMALVPIDVVVIVLTGINRGD